MGRSAGWAAAWESKSLAVSQRRSDGSERGGGLIKAPHSPEAWEDVPSSEVKSGVLPTDPSRSLSLQTRAGVRRTGNFAGF